MSTNAPVAPPLPAVLPPAAPALPAGAPPLVLDGSLRIPAGIGDLESFRRWARSEEAPDHVRVAWLAGLIWVDRTMEQFYTHNAVKTEVSRVLSGLARSSRQGRYAGDGMLVSSPAADLSTIPDGLFVSFASLQGGRVRQVPGRIAGVVELEGSPDMVLEVVSESSVEKDTVRLPSLYQQADVREFWRIDVRQELSFEIFQLTDAGYVPTQEPDGWWRSPVFGASFRMTRQLDPLGQPEFTLETRP